MTWTYTNNASNVSRDSIRLLVGDTDQTDQLVTDEEIAYALTQRGNAQLAAAFICKAIATKFARFVDKEVGDLKQSYSQRVTQYKEMAEELEASGSIGSAVPFAGGISVADKESERSDTDRVDPRFREKQFDNRGASTNDRDPNRFD